MKISTGWAVDHAPVCQFHASLAPSIPYGGAFSIGENAPALDRDRKRRTKTAGKRSSVKVLTPVLGEATRIRVDPVMRASDGLKLEYPRRFECLHASAGHNCGFHIVGTGGTLRRTKMSHCNKGGCPYLNVENSYQGFSLEMIEYLRQIAHRCTALGRGCSDERSATNSKVSAWS